MSESVHAPPPSQAAEPDPEVPADRHADRSHGRPGHAAPTTRRMPGRGAIGTCSPGPFVGPASTFGRLYAGQLSAERAKTRVAAAVLRTSQPARTGRLRAASVEEL